MPRGGKSGFAETIPRPGKIATLARSFNGAWRFFSYFA
jgi:hypothetical protein